MPVEKTYLVTSALPYANGALHLGHLAGAYLPADIYVRYLRLQGRKVLWVCGSDEHGAAITIRAKKEGISPREIIDKYHELNKRTFEQLGISFDYYHRTSSPLHHQTSQDFFLRLYERGDQFEERELEQYYDEAFDQFLADRYITGTCPRCHYEAAFGDQCENCGSDLSPLELIEPRSTLSGEPPVLRKTKHWYFRLDKHEDWLREWIEAGTLDGQPHHDPKTWKKHVLGQCLSWIDNGLQARSITRDLSWGIPVPLPEAEGKVLYVWFDAPIGYISSTRKWAAERGEDWEDYWKGGEEVELIHFIGKDNIVFHCVIFPAMLRAHGDFVLPKNVPANQFLNFEGEKFSKSRGWGVEQHDYLEAFADFPNREDALRYALTRNMPENRDSDFTWNDFVDFHDKELADNLGNFINRVIVLTGKYFDRKVPSAELDLTEALGPVLNRIEALEAALEAFSFKQAVQILMDISSWGNTYLQEAAPWALYKADPDDPRIAACMLVGLQTVALLSILCEPFIPFTSPKIRKLLGLEPVGKGAWADAVKRLREGTPLLAPGHRIGKPALLFAKVHDRKDDSRLRLIEQQKAKLQAIQQREQDQAPEGSEVEAPGLSEAEDRPAPKDEIEFDQFAGLDLRTATIVAAEKVEKADRLLKLTVDLGTERRTVVSGIAEQYRPDEIVGQEVVLVANLKARKLRGIRSQGMVLMAEDSAGRLSFVQPAQSLGNGWVVR